MGRLSRRSTTLSTGARTRQIAPSPSALRSPTPSTIRSIATTWSGCGRDPAGAGGLQPEGEHADHEQGAHQRREGAVRVLADGVRRDHRVGVGRDVHDRDRHRDDGAAAEERAVEQARPLAGVLGVTARSSHSARSALPNRRRGRPPRCRLRCHGHDHRGVAPSRARRRPDDPEPVRRRGRPVPLLRLRLAASSSPARTTYDTRAELTERPVELPLAAAFTLWHPESNFGEFQNQAYGYLFPQGSFFALADVARCPGLGDPAALVGAGPRRRLRGRPPGGAERWAAAGPAALLAGWCSRSRRGCSAPSPCITGESLPGAVMPWVVLAVLLLPRGPAAPVRAAVLSGAAVVCMGGVNAVENAGCLPLAVILVVWGVTPDAHHLAVRGRLVAAVGAASLWWVLPLLVLAGYAPPFYEYVESAPNTTALVGWSEAVRGDSHWVAYLVVGRPGRGGRRRSHLATDPVLVVVAAVVAAIGPGRADPARQRRSASR